MVQNVISKTIPAGQQGIFFEKPHILHRIFFGITAMLNNDVWRQSRISFDDPTFHSYYVLDGQFKHFEMKGEEIFQGNIFVSNQSTVNILYSTVEILI